MQDRYIFLNFCFYLNFWKKGKTMFWIGSYIWTLTEHQNDNFSKKAHSLVGNIIKMCELSMEIKREEKT